jgi:DNA-binding XRE family transcriptional regulator
MVQENQNSDLAHYRKRMRFTQSHVLSILGWKNKKGLFQIESGNVTPTLHTALKLAIIYRVPVEFLFKSLYDRLHIQVRHKESTLPPVEQPILPLVFSSTEQ